MQGEDLRSRLRVGVGVSVKVGLKDCVGVLHHLGGEGCYVGKGNERNFQVPLAPPYVWPVDIDHWQLSGPGGQGGGEGEGSRT